MKMLVSLHIFRFRTFEVLLIMIFKILSNNVIHTCVEPQSLSTEMTTNESNGNIFDDFGQTQNSTDILKKK